MTGRPLRPEEKRAWARVVKSVRARPGIVPLDTMEEIMSGASGSSGKPSKKPRPQGVPRGITPSIDARVSSHGAVANRGHERKVRRGQMPIAATLDLHGHTQTSAHDKLTRFLASQKALGASCVLVITGKGKQGEGILRRRFLQWLESAEAKGLASGYAPAHRKHGGGGAWYVFLRLR